MIAPNTLRIAGVSLGLLATLSLTSCQTAQGALQDRTTRDAVIGTIVGAAAGAALDSNKRGRGALIGAVVGGLAGGAIGSKLGNTRHQIRPVKRPCKYGTRFCTGQILSANIVHFVLKQIVDRHSKMRTSGRNEAFPRCVNPIGIARLWDADSRSEPQKLCMPPRKSKTTRMHMAHRTRDTNRLVTAPFIRRY